MSGLRWPYTPRLPTRTLFAVTVFLSAFLLFQVQPLMGRYVLPWFGGGPGVWTTCMLFFQVALLVGYGYAHLLSTALPARRQALVHGAVLALTLLTLPIVPDIAWRPSGDDEPVGHILLLLMLSVGGPFAVLAASAPLLASWYRLALPGGSPYRLYALSNAGSLLALLGYPLVVEPSLGLGVQGAAWSWAYGTFALVCGGCAWQLARRSGNGAAAATATGTAAGPGGAAPTLSQTFVWVLMSAVGSVVLLATTSRMSQEVSVVPLLWVLPLAVYLLTFILCFERDGWYDRRVVLPLLTVSLAAVLVTLFRVTHIDFRVEVAVLVVAQFACCMVCHGELVRRRPAERYLTRFYLALSVGGAAGGVLTAIVAPLVFTRYWEYHLGLAATVVIATVCVLADRRRRGGGSTSEFARRLRSGATAFLVGGGLAVAVVSLMTDPRIWFGDGLGGGIDASRNFFGLVRIKEGESHLGTYRKMVNGTTSHGVQYLGGTDEAAPRSYFGPRSGLGVALEARRLRVAGQEGAGRSLRIGAVGLGVGTVAAAAEPGDSVRVYEINPEVERLARKHFTYLSGAAAAGVDVEVVIGDARVSLDREAERGELHRFDVLVVDAFNGDSVPIHLITHDAYTLYRRHLQPDGVIAFHVSNRYLGLTTIVRDVAESFGDQAVRVLSADEPWSGNSAARWVLASSDRAVLESERVRVESTPWLATETPSRVWTDDFASLWDALRLGRSMAPGKWDDAPNGGRFVSDDGEFISEADEDHIRRRCRAMYALSDGRRLVFVTAVSSDAAGSAGAPSLDGAAHPSAVLLTCSDDDQHVALRFGAGLSPETQERFTSAVSSAFARRAASDGMSAAVRAAIDVLEPLVLAR